MSTAQIINADARHIPLASESVQCAITSPPYFGLRSYLKDDNSLKAAEIGIGSLDEYIANMVAVFREVRRVLKPDGVLFLNLGDSYNGSGGAGGDYGPGGLKDSQPKYPGRRVAGLKPKDLIGVPWRVAFALQADGWWLRSEIIWHKPNPTPESATDRPTKAHEQIFLLTKAARYFYDADAIAEPAIHAGETRITTAKSFAGQAAGANVKPSGNAVIGSIVTVKPTRNRRSVWTISTSRYTGAHFATFPPQLVEPMILAGSRPGDTVLDPFAGTATVGAVALKHHRNFIGLELNAEYIPLAEKRLSNIQPTLLGL